MMKAVIKIAQIHWMDLNVGILKVRIQLHVALTKAFQINFLLVLLLLNKLINTGMIQVQQ